MTQEIADVFKADRARYILECNIAYGFGEELGMPVTGNGFTVSDDAGNELGYIQFGIRAVSAIICGEATSGVALYYGEFQYYDPDLLARIRDVIKDIKNYRPSPLQRYYFNIAGEKVGEK